MNTFHDMLQPEAWSVTLLWCQLAFCGLCETKLAALDDNEKNEEESELYEF